MIIPNKFMNAIVAIGVPKDEKEKLDRDGFYCCSKGSR